MIYEPFITLLTGFSGSGKSIALKFLEDAGFQTFDNVPLRFVQEICDQQEKRHFAFGVDTRTIDFSRKNLEESLNALKQRYGQRVRLVFLDSDHGVLEKRFRETRRLHPLMHRLGALTNCLAYEAQELNPLKDQADVIIDTSLLAPPELRRHLSLWIVPSARSQLGISVLSFGFPYGVPREADMVYDVRFLRNPHYVVDLKKYSGQHEKVRRYVIEDKAFAPFMNHVYGMLEVALPLFSQDHRAHTVIAFGCTGGQHRSVTAAYMLHQWLINQGYTADLYHRELMRITEHASALSFLSLSS